MNWLRYDSPLSEGARFLGNLVILNLCYILCCLPIVTIGPATAALFSALYISEDETWAIRKFWRGIRINFRQGLCIWLILLVPTALMVVSFYLVGVLKLPGYQVIQGLLIVLFLVLACVRSFAYALQARYENSVKQTLRNALIIGIYSPIPSLLMNLMTSIPVIVFLVNLDLFTYVFSFWLLMGFSLVTWINSRIVSKVLKHVLPAN